MPPSFFLERGGGYPALKIKLLTATLVHLFPFWPLHARWSIVLTVSIFYSIYRKVQIKDFPVRSTLLICLVNTILDYLAEL